MTDTSERAAPANAADIGRLGDDIKRRLDRITKLLEQLCSKLDPYPGYAQSSDGRWRNNLTGADYADDMLKKMRQQYGV